MVLRLNDRELMDQMANGAKGPGMGVPRMGPERMGAMGTPKGMAAGIRSKPAGIPKMATKESVRTHGLAIGGLQHAMKVHPDHAPAIKAMMGASRAHIESYRPAKPLPKPMRIPPRFGALGGPTGLENNLGPEGKW
jgi:hypothetical protein